MGVGCTAEAQVHRTETGEIVQLHAGEPGEALPSPPVGAGLLWSDGAGMTDMSGLVVPGCRVSSSFGFGLELSSQHHWASQVGLAFLFGLASIFEAGRQVIWAR